MVSNKKKNRFSFNGNGIMSSFLGRQFYRSTLYKYIFNIYKCICIQYIYIYKVKLLTIGHGNTKAVFGLLLDWVGGECTTLLPRLFHFALDSTFFNTLFYIINICKIYIYVDIYTYIYNTHTYIKCIYT